MQNKDEFVPKGVISRALRVRDSFNARKVKPYKYKNLGGINFSSYFCDTQSEKYRNPVQKKRKIKKIVKLINEGMKEAILEAQGGLFIEGIGYFCHMMPPNPQPIVGYKNKGTKVYDNSHTEGYMYFLTFFPARTKNRNMKNWSMLYCKNIKSLSCKELLKGNIYNLHLSKLRKYLTPF